MFFDILVCPAFYAIFICLLLLLCLQFPVLQQLLQLLFYCSYCFAFGCSYCFAFYCSSRLR